MRFTAPKVSAHRPRHSCWVLEELLVIAATQLSEMMKNIRPLDIKVQKYVRIAPVLEQSGKKSWTHWRYSCPTFLRQTSVE
jgi:hypothetical protein